MAWQPSSTSLSSKPAGEVRAADLQLVRRCREGDVSAFEEVYKAHSARLYSLLLRMVGGTQDAEDLLQDVFLQAYRKLDSFRGDSSLGTWLYRLAVNQSLDFLRGRQSRMNRATDSFEDEAVPEPSSPAPAIPAAISRVDLERAVARLPEGCRLAFVLHDVEGFAHHEVASLLGISEGTSKSQVHKARLKLRAMLNGVVR
jgi:RNA polymerase sigma-70 factor (ECF subfamily)